MNFSLRWLLGLVVFLCLILGGREAYRSYHWHRNLPVTYSFSSFSFDGGLTENLAPGNQVRFPRKLKISFDDELANRLTKVAGARRRAEADQFFKAKLELAKRLDEQRGWVPARLSYQRTLSANLQRLLRENWREFFAASDSQPISLGSKIRLLPTWLRLQDDPALQQAIAYLNSDDSATRVTMIKSLDCVEDPFCLQWLAQSRELEIALVDCFIDAPEAVGNLSLVLRFKTASKPMMEKVASCVVNKHVEQMDAGEYQSLLEKLTWLEKSCRLEATSAQLDVIKKLAQFLIKRDASDSPSPPSDPSQGIETGVRLATARKKFQRVLFEFGRTASVDLKVEVASLAYSLNDFRTFMKFASRIHQPEIEKLFESRAALAEKGRFAGQYAREGRTYQSRFDIELRREESFSQECPNPITGMESTFFIQDFMDYLDQADEGFARSCVRALVFEDTEQVIERCAEFLTPTDQEVAVHLGNHLGNHLLRPAAGRRPTPRFQTVSVIEKVFPDLVQAPRFASQRELARRLSLVPGVEKLRMRLAKFGLKQPGLDSGKTPADLKDVFARQERIELAVLEAFRANGRLAFVEHLGNREFPEAVEDLVRIAQLDFDLECVEKTDNGQFLEYRLVGSDRIYQLETRSGRLPRRVDLRLVDLLNHILIREQIPKQYAVIDVRSRSQVTNGYRLGKYVLFAEPELLRELRDRYRIDFLPANDFYLE